MSQEDDDMESFCGWENTEEEFQDKQDEKRRVAEEKLDETETTNAARLDQRVVFGGYLCINAKNTAS